MAPKKCKRMNKNLEALDKDKSYTLDEALDILKKQQPTKFDETIEMHVRLGVNPRHADQIVRGTIILPHGIGKKIRVVVFAEGEDAKLAEDAGADEVGSKELIEKIKDGWLEFDVAISQPQMMREVGKIGKILGPRGLMPNPKSGTVTADLASAVKEFKSGKIEYRVDKTSIIHVPVGKLSFDKDQLFENMKAMFSAIVKARPAAAKGQYIRSVYITSSMGPGIRIDGPSFVNLVKQGK